MDYHPSQSPQNGQAPSARISSRAQSTEPSNREQYLMTTQVDWTDPLPSQSSQYAPSPRNYSRASSGEPFSPSQFPQHGPSPVNSLHTPNLMPSGEFQFQSKPLPALPPTNHTQYSPQYFPAMPQPLLMADYNPWIPSSSLQPGSRSEYSSQSVYGTPQEYSSPNVGTPNLYSPAQTPQGHPQDVEMLEDHAHRQTQMPGGYEPMSSTQHDQQWAGDQRSSYQQMDGGIHYAHGYGAQPTPGPSTTNYQQTSWGNQESSRGTTTISGRTAPGPSTTNYQQASGENQNVDTYNVQPSQHDYHQMPQASQSLEPGDEYRRKVPSRTSTRDSTPSIAAHRGHQQTNGGVPYVAQPTPGPSNTTNRVLPRLDLLNVGEFQEIPSKIRVVEHPDIGAYRGVEHELIRERRGRRDANLQLKATANQTLLNTLEREANERTRKAEKARESQQERTQRAEAAAEKEKREKEKLQMEYETSLATLSQRFAVQGTPLPPQQQPEFPNAPPALKPRYIPETTRRSRQLDTINRNVGGKLPHIRLVHGENEGNEGSSSSESEGEGVSRKGKGPRGKGLRLREILDSDKQALKGLVEEVVKGMNVTKIGKPRSRRRVGRAAILKQAKQTQQSQLTTEDDLNCKMVVREIFRISTRLNRAEDFKDYEPATEDQAAHCGDQDGEMPLPGVSPFYFGKGWKTSMWNDMLLRGLVADLRRKQTEDPHRLGIPDVSTSYLIALFLNCLDEGRCAWRKHKPRFGESEEMAQARAKESERSMRKAKTSRARKETKWKKRTATAKKMVLLCANEPNNVEIWQWVRRLLELLGTLGMSSEDAIPQKYRFGANFVMQTTHVIQICPWRAKKVAEILDNVDTAADEISLKTGTAARPRIRSNGESNTPAPHGLPETLYDEQWMADGLEIDPDFKNDLHVSEEAFQIMEIVARDLEIDEEDMEEEDDTEE
ncbi:hypothetical protein C8R44DRAFT_742926 [Mycena epipterygia]|nr:hypothetical protein C8R44DRAFT_742926 [Mycena epipterygia]